MLAGAAAGGAGDEQARRAGAARDDLQAVQDGHAVRPRGHVEDDRLAVHRHVAEDDILSPLLPRVARLPAAAAHLRDRPEGVRAGLEREHRVLLARHIRLGVAVAIEVVAPRRQAADGDGDVAAVLGEDVGVVHRVAAGVAPDPGRILDGDGHAGLGAVGELELVELAVGHQRHPGRELRLVMAVEVPVVVGAHARWPPSRS